MVRFLDRLDKDKGKRKAFGTLSGNRPIFTSKPSARAAVKDGKGRKGNHKSDRSNEDDESSLAHSAVSSITSYDTSKVTRKHKGVEKEKENLNSKSKSSKRSNSKQNSKTKVLKYKNGNTQKKENKAKPSKTNKKKNLTSNNRWKPSLPVLAEISETESVTISVNEQESLATVDLDSNIDTLFELSERNKAMNANENEATEDFLDKMDMSNELSIQDDAGYSSSNTEGDDESLDSLEKKLPSGWVVRYSRSKNGRPYFINYDKKIKTWIPPCDLTSKSEQPANNSIDTSKSIGKTKVSKKGNHWSSYVKLTATQKVMYNGSARVLKAPLCSLQFLDESINNQQYLKRKLVGQSGRKKKRRSLR
jgi:hypothetical protein